MKHKFSENCFEPGYRVYKVGGSYDIRISDHANCVTGNQGGFNLEVSDLDGNFDGCGGVLGRKQAKALADRIYEVLERCTDTEEELLDSVYTRIDWRRI
jgi:hypothetical protein